MGVHPGQSGQSFLGEPIINKVRHVHMHHPEVTVSCDGGVGGENMHDLKQAGCCKFVMASAIYGSDNPVETLRMLTDKLIGKK